MLATYPADAGLAADRNQALDAPSTVAMVEAVIAARSEARCVQPLHGSLFDQKIDKRQPALFVDHFRQQLPVAMEVEIPPSCLRISAPRMRAPEGKVFPTCEQAQASGERCTQAKGFSDGAPAIDWVNRGEAAYLG